jgi:hypothetical protein
MPRKKTERDEHFIQRMKQVATGVGSVLALSKKTGIPQSTLANYFVGGEPGRVQLAAIAKGAGVELTWLITGEGPRVRSEVEVYADECGDSLTSQLDGYDVDMDRFFAIIKEWWADGTGRGPSDTDEFREKFKAAFPELREWLKKRAGDRDMGELQKPPRGSGYAKG